MKILVITACTARKKHEPPNQLQPKDFATPGLLRLGSRRLEEFETPAAQMYTGDGHLHLMNGVKNLRRTFGQGIVDVRIISPGYGLLNEDDPIVPYDYTFAGLGQAGILKIVLKLEIHEEIKRLLPSYDLAFFLLSDDYVTACRLPFRVPNPVTQIFLVGPKSQDRILADGRHVRAVCVGDKLIRQFDEANKNNLKGVVFERLCRVACERGLEVFEEVRKNPQLIIKMVVNCN